jgi:hypothetical protein
MATKGAPLRPWRCNLLAPSAPCSSSPLHSARTYRTHGKASRLRYSPTGVIHPTCDDLATAYGHPTPALGPPQPRYSDTLLVELDWATTKTAERPHLYEKTLLGRFKSTVLGLATRIVRRYSTETMRTGRFYSLFDAGLSEPRGGNFHHTSPSLCVVPH